MSRRNVHRGWFFDRILRLCGSEYFSPTPVYDRAIREWEEENPGKPVWKYNYDIIRADWSEFTSEPWDPTTEEESGG